MIVNLVVIFAFKNIQVPFSSVNNGSYKRESSSYI